MNRFRMLYGLFSQPYGLLWAANIVLMIGLWRGEFGYERYMKLLEAEVVLEKSLKGIEEESQRLLQQIEYLKKSPEYARRLLKDKYHVLDEGEHIIFFDD